MNRREPARPARRHHHGAGDAPADALRRAHPPAPEGRLYRQGRPRPDDARRRRPGLHQLLRDEERRSSKSAAASAVQQARAEEINLRVAKERSKLIETDEVEDAISDILGQLRAGFDGLPASVTRDAALRDKIEQKVNSIVVAL